MKRDEHGVLRDDNGVELVRMPAGYLELLRDRDAFTLAVKTYEELLTLTPPRIPAPRPFSKPELIKLWRKRGIPVSDTTLGIGQPDTLKVEFMGWLESELDRSDAIDEAKRRLRSTMWAQIALRASSRRPDAVAVLSRFHLDRYNISSVEELASAREDQIEKAIRQLARRT